MNLARFDRSRLLGGYVSREQPSTIDDPTIKNGFYGAPTVVAIFGQDGFAFRVADAFCMAENMLLPGNGAWHFLLYYFARRGNLHQR